jgi:hypothetical protein
VINTGNYSAIHVNHEVQLAIPDGDLQDPKYAALVKDAQNKVDKVVMEHQMKTRDQVNEMLDKEAEK